MSDEELAGNDYRAKQSKNARQAKKDFDLLKPTLTDDVLNVLNHDKHLYRGNVEAVTEQKTIVSELKADKDEVGYYKATYTSDGTAVPYTDTDITKIDTEKDEVMEAIANKEFHRLTLKENQKQERYSDLKTILKWLVGMLIDSKDKTQDVEVLNVAAQLGLRQGISHTVIASMCGCTKQNFSKKVIAMKEALGLPQDDRESKKVSSRKTYKNTNRGNHKL